MARYPPRETNVVKRRVLRMPAFWDLPPVGVNICNLTTREKHWLKIKEDKEVQDRLRAQAWCKALDRQFYKSENSQMRRRLNAENEERSFEECKQQAEEARGMRDNLHTQERNFAIAMEKMKDKEICEASLRKQLYESTPEVRKLERQIRTAYYAKTLYAQRIERESIKLEEKMRNHDSHEMLMEKLKQMEIEDEEKCKADQQKKAEYMRVLKNQMEGARSKEAMKFEDFQRDKALIDEIVELIRQEELKEQMEKQLRLQKYQEEVKKFEESQKRAKREEQLRQAEEERKIQQYLASKSQQAAEIAKAHEEREKVKAELAAKSAEKIMEDRMRAEELEDLRRELFQEMLQEEVRRKDAEEAAKKYQQMLELQEAEKEAKMIRQKKLENERKEMEDFRRQVHQSLKELCELMEKFAEDERLEQLSQERRRQKEREHRKLVEEMIIERRARHAQEQEQLHAELRCFDQEAEQREKYAQEEKLRLLRLHGPHILGFMPRGVITIDDIEKLGEPFKTYYASIKRVPDPTTVDPPLDC